MFVENILEALRLHVTDKNNKEFEFPEGDIVFSDNHNKETKYEVCIYSIRFKKEFRKKGLFTSLMNEIITNYLLIEKVLIIDPNPIFSVILQTSKFGGRYFVKKEIVEMHWARSGEKDQEISERMSQILTPVRRLLVDGDYENFYKIIYSPEISSYF